MTTLTAQHEQRALAYELISRKLRTRIVHLHTRIPLADIRDWHHEVHGRSPSSGLLPSMSTLLPNRNSQIYVSVFAAIYLRIGGPGYSTRSTSMHSSRLGSLSTKLMAHLDKNRPAEITDAWVIARDLCGRGRR
jgi:hypothetical protein